MCFLSFIIQNNDFVDFNIIATIIYNFVLVKYHKELLINKIFIIKNIIRRLNVLSIIHIFYFLSKMTKYTYDFMNVVMIGFNSY